MFPRAALVVERALTAGARGLFEPEGFALLAALDIGAPAHRVVTAPADVRAGLLAGLGPRVVVKAIAPDLPHKTDVGAVAVVDADPAAVRSAMEVMAARLRFDRLAGYLLQAYVEQARDFGGELLVALRQTLDFGPVVTVGAGGLHAELVGRALRAGADVAVFAAEGFGRDTARERLLELPVTRVACGAARGGRRLVDVEHLVALIERLLAFGGTAVGSRVAELEINPLVLTGAEPVALDVLTRLRPPAEPPRQPRPLAKLARLLTPSTAAVVGVSEGLNVGRYILRNMLREGFPPDRLVVVKPGGARLDGVRCVPSFAELPNPVDLCVLAVGAAQVPGLVRDIVVGRLAESVIVIPGGLGERAGSGDLEAGIHAAIDAARTTSWGGPVVNGGNCLGIRSAPGRYDTTFIPAHKLGPRADADAPVALIAQSGAFAVARWSRLAGAAPRYLISVGNQTDLTIGDYLTYLKDDPAVAVFACYVEGFRPLDGARWLAAAAEIVRSGRTVVLYRAARTAAGRAAGASHTATIAGDYVVTRELATAAGVQVADTLDEFDDLLRLCALLADRPAAGVRLGVVSNAGFECVAVGDAADPLRLATLSSRTQAVLDDLLARHRLAGVVDVRHPLDLTPLMDDAGFVEAFAAVLEDEGVDVGVAGIVPLTGALQTLPAGDAYAERLDAPDGIVARLARLRHESPKPFVAVVDAGAPYDPLAAALEAVGVPAFRTMDRALRALARLGVRAPGGACGAAAPALAGACT
jgi:acyl-CoA synthetase (NDP forming)